MSGARRQRRLSWVALAAISGAFLATTGMTQPSMAEGRRCGAAPALASCCAGHPETCTRGCCCSSSGSAPSPAESETDGIPAPARLSTSRTVCIPAACQCRSNEPAAPASKPDRRTVDDRCDVGESALSAWLGHVLSPAPAPLVLWDPGGHLNCPLHLLATH